MAENTLNNELVSIVIPVYNAEKYLERLIDSIFAQTHKNIEVIAAYESASTDDTLEVLQNLAKKYPLIISIGSERCPGGTRNRGFESATGEFVVFVDADDYLLPDYLSSFLHVFREHPELDVVCCNYQSIKNFADFVPNDFQLSKNHYYLYSQEVWIKRLLAGKEKVMPWLYMIRRKFIIDTNMIFTTLYYGEDDLYAYTLASNCDNIGKIDDKTYLYINNDSGIVGSRTKMWFSKSVSAYHLIPEVLETVSPSLARIYRCHYNRHVAFSSAKTMKYNEWIDYLKDSEIKFIHISRYRTKIMEILGTLVFNFSKRIYYHLQSIYINLIRG